jgi:hypothetical protein
MGAWAEGSFDNDDACDWVWNLEDARDVTILEDAFGAVTTADEYLESPECSEAIAAAEVVAAMRKRPCAKPPKEVQDFAKRINAPPPPELIAWALEALERIKTKSELKDLWDESESAEKWQQSVADLEARLR